MKKSRTITFLIILLALLYLEIVEASPFLVCDPPPATEPVEYYEVDGLPAPFTGRNIPRDNTGKYGFQLDLATLPVGGPWTLKARACNAVWGCSDDSAPYVLNRPPKIGKIVGTIQLIK
jgi:hypothetical protein